jgi:hypothetical protein
MPSDAENMYPITLEPHMGPLIWTPMREGDTAVNKEVVYYNWRALQHETLSEDEMNGIIVAGCRGGSPRAIDIAWSEPAAALGADADAKERRYSECILAETLSLRELLSIVAGSYGRSGRLPPVGMTLRWILADPMARRIRLEFKGAAEVGEIGEVIAAGAAKKRFCGGGLIGADERWSTAQILCAGMDADA